MQCDPIVFSHCPIEVYVALFILILAHFEGCPQEENVDYYGSDIHLTWPWPTVSDPDACNELCVQNDDCTHWTFEHSPQTITSATSRIPMQAECILGEQFPVQSAPEVFSFSSCYTEMDYSTFKSLNLNLPHTMIFKP